MLRLNVEFPLNLCEKVNRKILVINVIRIQCCLWLDFMKDVLLNNLKLGQWCAFYMDFRVCMWYTMASGVLRQSLLCSSAWLGTHYIDHTGLELTDPSASASSWVLGL